jgi:aspartyl-tRNA(Asn)/glutamyl-tRNA(Gln) amidotransferase subunit A
MTPIQELQNQIQSGVSPKEVVEEAIIKLKNSEHYNSTISDMFEAALSRAKELERSPKKGRLYGIPFIAKDNLAIKGTKTTAASNILGNYYSPYTATAIKKLEDEGAICIAKANMDSFGHGSSTENSDFAAALNPHDQTRVPGGSSGGSASVVALGVVPFAIGTDTGGSIRQPASFTGTFGIKPSYGRVSRNGAIAMASSTDTVGVIASTSQDLSLVLDVISGKDPKDSTTIEKTNELELKTNPNPSQYKVAVIKEFLTEGLDQEVRDQVLRAIARLKASGVKVDEVSIPEVEYALAAYYIIIPAEISSNLARYDGIRYGYSTENSSNLDETYQKSRMEGLNHENKRRVLIGTYVLSSGYYDAYYKKAQQVRTLLRNAFEKTFEKYDAVLGPVAPTTAFKVGETEDPIKMYLGDIMTVSASLIGSPAASVPVGLGSDSNMPVGLQIIARHGQDQKVLSLSKLIEEAVK